MGTTTAVYGQVSDASGAPVSGAVLILSMDGDNSQQFTATSDGEGGYGLAVDPGPGDGGYTLSVSHPGYVGTSLSLEIGSGQEIRQDVVLGAAFATLSGKVIDATPGAGNPIGGALISVEGARSTAKSAEDGTYTIRGIPAGPALVSVSKLKYQTLADTYTFTAGQTLSLETGLEHPGLPV